MEMEIGMEHQQTGHLNNDFRTSLHHVLEFGEENHARGTSSKELLNYNISLLDPRNRIINFEARKTNLKYLLGEFVWYLNGSSDPEVIIFYSKFWNNIRNKTEDMVPAGYELETVNSNYGHRIFGRNMNLLVPKAIDGVVRGISQWKSTIELLSKDKETRQAIMNIHVPADRHAGNSDVPCTLTLQFFIRQDRLHLIVNMRSNDAILGFTNDVFQFTMLQEAMLCSIKGVYPELKLGRYMHNAGSYHIYDRHYDMAKAIIADDRELELSMVPMDSFNEDVVAALIHVEHSWRVNSENPEFEIEKVESWSHLTPYWQNLVKMCFIEDEESMHGVFGIEE